MIPRLKAAFNTGLNEEIKKELGLENVNQIPTLEKIVLNIGSSKAATDGRTLESIVDELTAISGQKPVIKRAKKSIAGFKVREGMPVGVSVTLRGDRMWEFYDRFILFRNDSDCHIFYDIVPCNGSGTETNGGT